MSIKKYETLLRTVDLGSLTRASEELGYTQSAISHTLTSLEEELGLRILVRDRAGVRLTEEGARLLPAIREICRANEELLRQISQLHGLEVGTVRIGSFLSVSTSLLPDLIAEFSQLHPNINFELLQGSYFDIERWISEERIDVGFIRLPAGLKNLDCIQLIEEELLAVFPSDRPIEAAPFPVEKLSHETLILRPDAMEPEKRDIVRQIGTQPKISYSAKDDYTVMALVARGLGMSILPELLLQQGNHRLQTRRLEPTMTRRIGIACKSMQLLAPAAGEFVAFTQKRFSMHNMKKTAGDI